MKETNEKIKKAKVAYYMSMLNAASYFFNMFCNAEEQAAIRAEYEQVMREQMSAANAAEQNGEEA